MNASSRRSPRAPLATILSALVVCGCFGGGGFTPIQTAFNKGVYHYSQKNYDQAIQEYLLALEENPADYRARFNLALTRETLATMLDESDPARAAALRQDAARGYGEVLAQEPDNLRAAVNLAASEYPTDPAGAKARLLATMEAHPDAMIPRTALAAHLVREARAEDGAVREAGLRRALEILGEALAIDETHVGTNMLLGNVHAALGDGTAARSAYDQALVREPNDIATLVARGRLEMDEGRPDEARVWLYRVLYLDDDHFEAHFRLHRCAVALEDWEEATRHLWDARRSESTRPGTGIPKPDYAALLRELYQRLLSGPTGGD